jgi:hypothetical protein
MKNKKMFIIGGIIAVAGIGFFWYRNKKKAENPDDFSAPKPKIDEELTTPKGQTIVDTKVVETSSSNIASPSSVASSEAQVSSLLMRMKRPKSMVDVARLRQEYAFYVDKGGTLPFMQWMKGQKGKKETNSKASQNTA